jgi:hypothetical protein
VKRAALLCCLLLALTGCQSGVDFSAAGGLPKCQSTSDIPSGGVLLMAQAVPTSAWVSCLELLPIGWHFEELKARDGKAEFTLGSDRDGPRPVTVLLARSCRVQGSEKPSERPGMKRYERTTRLTGGYAGERYYTYPGGCISYRFNLTGQSRADPVGEISDALGVVSRQSLREWVYERSDGRLELDPDATASLQ